MTDVMQQLGIEHRNMARLLNVLEQQLAIFERGDEPDYDVIEAIATYFTGFPDRCHHPKEDMILARLRERAPEVAARVGDLEAEHEEISRLAKRFDTTVQEVLNEAEIPREVFSAVVRDFIERQRSHMQDERAGFFLQAEAKLTDEDWEALNATLSDEKDPMFSKDFATEFEALHEQIMRWQEEDEKAVLMDRD